MDKDKTTELARKLRQEGLSYREISGKLAAAGFLTETGKPINPGSITRWLNQNKPLIKKNTAQMEIPECQEPTPEKRIKCLENAYGGALKEVDRLTDELSKERKQVTILQRKLSVAGEEAGVDMSELEQVVMTAVSEAVKPLYQEIAAMKEKYESFLRINKPREQNPVHVSGWNVQKTGKYFKAYRKVNEKVRGIHIGPEFAPEEAKEKIIGAIRRNGHKWGLTEAEIAEMTGGEAPPADGSQDLREQVIEIIRRNGGDSRTAAIWKCVRDAEQAGIDRETFRKIVDGMVRELVVELAYGDPAFVPDNERDALLWTDETGKKFYSLIWHGKEN